MKSRKAALTATVDQARVMTIASDDEVEEEDESGNDHESVRTSVSKGSGKKRQRQEGQGKAGQGFVNPDFSFDMESTLRPAEIQAMHGWDFKSAIAKLAQQDPNRARSSQALENKISARRLELVKKRKSERPKAKGLASPGDGTSKEEEGDDEDLADSSTEVKVTKAGSTGQGALTEDGKDGGDDGEDGDDDDEEGNEDADEVNKALENDALRELSTVGREKKRKRDAKAGASQAVSGQDVIDEDRLEAEKAEAFFEDGDRDVASLGGAAAGDSGVPFQQLNLSRPLLRAVETMGFVNPTPIQQRAIPFALAGRDVCASAMTGSGKTAAFMLPILERLLFRPKKMAVTRVMVITPTRELGVQIHSMSRSLAQFTDISAALIVGGNKNLRPQEAELRARPDIVICTPGRMVDHLTNSAAVHMDDVEILVLDEADRLLELGFQEQVTELVRACPIGRQTLLFSATMGTKVDDLARLALNKPVRVRASPVNSAPQRLMQEFIRIRQSREQDREAILLSLLARTFKTKTIVFFDTKALAHRLNIVLGLAGIKAAELHGNLAMTQRLEALDRFKSGEVTVLVATDLAARGLDITGVHTVINFEMPRSTEAYIHRVGRTARAGCGGRSVTLIGEGRRLVMKEVLRNQSEGVDIKSRAVPQSAIDHFRSKIEGMESSVAGILGEEKVEREARSAVLEVERAENMVEHGKEIFSRPARQWIVSEHRKNELAEASKAEVKAEELRAAGKDPGKLGKASSVHNGDRGNVDQGLAKKEREKSMHRMTRKKRRRLMAQEAAEKAAEQEAEELRAKGKPVPKQPSAKSLVKSARREAREAERKTADKPLAELSGMKRKLEVRGSGFDFDLNARKPTKTEQEGQEASSKSVDSRVSASKSRYNFTEFDPNRHLRRGGKKGSNAFKSKAKYKRKK